MIKWWHLFYIYMFTASILLQGMTLNYIRLVVLKIIHFTPLYWL